MSAARLLLSGYYGFDNFGDDAILQIFCRQWRRRRPQDTLCVLSAKPSETAKTYGVESVSRNSLALVRDELRRCNVFLSGGGGLLQNATSARSLLYYGGLLHQAARQRRTTAIFDQGIGPLNFMGKLIVRHTCAKVDLAVVRDEASAALLKSILPALDVRLGADPVFLTQPEPEEQNNRALPAEGIPSGAPLVAVVVRPSRVLDRMEPDVAQVIDTLGEQFGAQVVLVPFQRPMDVEAAVSIIRRCKSAPVLLNGNYDLPAMTALFKRCMAIIAMRLHALILAARLGLPFLAVAYDPKVSALLASLQYPLAPLQPGAGRSSVERLWAERPALSRVLAAAAVPLQQRAAQSFDWLQALVEGALS